MLIRFLGAHNTESFQYKFPGLLIDNVIAFDCGSICRSLTDKDILNIKNVFLTHRHFDHIRDVVPLAIINNQNGQSFRLYCNDDTYQAIHSHLYNHILYSDFFKKNTVEYHEMTSEESVIFDNYCITAYPVMHGVPALGYLIKTNNSSVFYTGDTSIGCMDTWKMIKPQVLITEVTCDNSFTEVFKNGPHLTPKLLEIELNTFNSIHNYYPTTYVVHLNPTCENQIKSELKEISMRMGCEIIVSHEDLEISI